MRARMLLIATIVMTALPASAQPSDVLVTLLAVRDAGGWRIDAEVEGVGVSSAVFTPPGGAAFVVPCENDPDVVLCERVDPAPPAAGFASLAALLAAYPAGNWALSVNDGARTATLPFDPQQPNGTVDVTSPANGASNASSTPSVAYQNGCANCGFLLFLIEDAATQGLVTEIEALRTGPPPLPSGQIAFADFFDGAPVALSPGDYRLIAGAGAGALGLRNFDQGTGPAYEFQYGGGASLETATTFRVPEPSAAGCAAVATLLALAHRRSAQKRAIS